MLTVLKNNASVDEGLVKELVFKNINFDEAVFEEAVERAVLVCDCRRVAYQQKAIVTLSFKARFWVYNHGKTLTIYAVKIEDCVRSVEQGVTDDLVIKIDMWNDCRLYNNAADDALLVNNQYNRLNEYAESIRSYTEELRKSLENIMLLVPEVTLKKNIDFRHLMTSNLAELQGYARDAVAVKQQNIFEEMDINRKERRTLLTSYGKRLEGFSDLKLTE